MRSKSVFCAALVGFSVNLLPAQSEALRELASVRQVPPGKVRLHRAPVITETQKTIMTEAVLAAFANRFNQIETLEDYDRLILSRLPTSDRKILKELLKGIELPKLAINGTTMEFKWRTYESMKIDWPDLGKPNVKVNGIDWVLTNKSVLSQSQLLVKKIEIEKKRRESALLQLALPPANAWVAVAGKGIGTFMTWMLEHKIAAPVILTVATNIGLKSFESATCWASTKAGSTLGGYCAAYLENVQKEKTLLTGNAPSVNAAKTVRETLTEEKTDWFARPAKECPSPGDKEENTYIADLVEVKYTNGKWVRQADWFTVKMEFSPTDSVVKKGLVVKGGTDLEKQEEIEANLFNRLVFDDKGTLKEIEVPNPKHDKNDPGSKPHLAIDMTTDDSVLDPTLKGRRENMKSLVASVNDYVKACMKQQQIEGYIKGRRRDRAQEKAGANDPAPAPAAPAPSSPAKTVN